jgi:hypothetical protein
MSERTERMVHSVVPWEQADPHVQEVLVAAGEEYDRIEALMVTVRDHAWPHLADDTYGLLAVHERAMQLTVAPGGMSLVFRDRRDGRKGTWARRMDALIGVGGWRAEEATPGPNQLRIYLNALASTGLASVYRPAVERFTPVVEELTITYEPSFILGESPLGDTEL